MDTTEIILNLWYIADELGVIYSLRAHAYVGVGTESEKLAFLRSRAELDYLVATAFPIPKAFHMHFINVGGVDELSPATEKTMPVVLVSSLEPYGGPIRLFEEVFREVERRLPSQTKLSVGESPLVCLTPVVQNADGRLQPRYSRTGPLPGTAG